MELQDVAIEDIEDVLEKVEQSFGIKFFNAEFEDVLTFGELCDRIVLKVHATSAEDCTSQQAFYKLRNAIAKVLCIDKRSLLPETELSGIFPKKNRRKKVGALENEVGFTLNILRPKRWLSISLMSIIVLSIVGLFIDWELGLLFLFVFVGLQYLLMKFGKEFAVKTIRQLVEKSIRENYAKVRRDQTSVNKSEIVQNMKELFIQELDLHEGALTNEAALPKGE